jgi:hypothetical protein
VFILEILDGDRAQSGSFWEVLKKHHRRHPIKLKKPEVTPGVAPVALKKPEVSPTTTLVAQAILKKPDQVGEDAMTGVEPSVSANPYHSCTFLSSLSVGESFFLTHCPFHHKFDCARIKKWLSQVKTCNMSFRAIGAIVRNAGHTDADRLQHIQVLVSAAGLPLPPPLFSATSSWPGWVRFNIQLVTVAKPFNRHTPSDLVVFELKLGVLLPTR